MKKKSIWSAVGVVCVIIGFSGIYVTADNNEEMVLINKQCQEVCQAMEEETDKMDYREELSNDEMEVYKDENDVIYCMEDGEIISFLKMHSDRGVSRSRKKDVKELREIADACVSKMNESGEYVFYDMKYNSDTGFYDFSYYKYIDDYKTTDLIYLSLDEFGEVMSAGNPNKGKFDNVKIELPNMEIIESFTDEMMTNKFGTDIEYNIDNIFVNEIDSEIKLEIHIFYKNNSGFTDSEIIYMNL